MWKSTDFHIPKKPVFGYVSASHDISRLIVVGDVHGCILELADLLKAVDPKPNDILAFTGDLVDKGPASAEVAETVMSLCIHRPLTLCCLGNHEEKHVRYRRWKYLNSESGVTVPMSFNDARVLEHNSLRDDVLAWMSGNPVAIIITTPNKPIGVRTVTHAGFLPGLPAQNTDSMIRTRYVREKSGKPGKFETANWFVEGETPEKAWHWTEKWDGGRVIYGHNIHPSGEVDVTNDCWGIDTGCAYGGSLSAYVETLDTGVVDIFRVKSREVYEKDEG